ncbi:ankyrin repeat domain-containing protein [Plantactinospora mayteni]|uniref:Serine/threonine protein kinase n=1 Tax=Plantactinospora mayteni TaxID=566021 RepID=A0ABQ4F2C8_9ACTN|nr:ankyrin repeat domain-containing protein [Plantactinospora mayteni]GIH01072.1 serine/threonine protein kinase [Plantactinospora mayteni]
MRTRRTKLGARRRKKLGKRLADAVLREDVPQVVALLAAGADPDAATPDGSTPLYRASVQGLAPVVRLLLAAGAAPDTESGHGDEGTPLTGAAAWGHTEVVRALLAYGADPDRREDAGTGATPLHWAVRGGHREAVELLRAATGSRRPDRSPCS